MRLQQRADDGDERAKAALELAHDPNQFLSTVQVGITWSACWPGPTAAPRSPSRWPCRSSTCRCSRPTPSGLALGLVVAVITVLSLIIGELVPKRIGLNHPETIAVVGGGADACAGAASAARSSSLLTASTNLVLRVFGVKGHAEPHLTEDEIRAVISQGAETGALEETEESLVQRVFRVGDQRVRRDHDAARSTSNGWTSTPPSEELREFLAGHSARASSSCATARSTTCSARCGPRICCPRR